MFSISSRALKILILDPEKDNSKFGLRFCTGGYIFQIEDSAGRPLLAGPTYPNEFVPVHGQGAPDTFNHIPLRIRGSEDVMILGIGRCNIESDRIVEPCHWTIDKRCENSISFSTRHTFNAYDIILERTISVESFKVDVRAKVSNNGSAYVPISWYPHPFFPPVKDGVMFSLPPLSVMEKPTGFFSNDGNHTRQANRNTGRHTPVVQQIRSYGRKSFKRGESSVRPIRLAGIVKHGF